MLTGFLKFDSIPEIGFAQHFYADSYKYSYGYNKKSFEIVYIVSGGIEAELYGEKIYANEGSIFVLFRHLPVIVKSIAGKPQAHCTVQAEFDYDFTLGRKSDIFDDNGIVLPFVTPPCKETEALKSELYSIVSDMGISRDKNAFSSSLRFLNLMYKIDTITRKKQMLNNAAPSIIEYKARKYISDNIHKKISLSEIAFSLKRSPEYINHVFKELNGITIGQYINREKTHMIASLMYNKALPFKTACNNVGITDISYGYRLFKNHTGVTPREYLSGNIYNSERRCSKTQNL